MHLIVLNKLVARSIVDPGFRQRFAEGRWTDDCEQLGAPADLVATLESISAPSWEEFVRLAYRCLKGLEAALEPVALPSALDGLVAGRTRDNQVA